MNNSRSIFYLILVILIAIFSALVGAVTGGILVLRLVRPTSAAPVSLVSATPTQPVQKLTYSSTDIQTSIVQAAENLSPAVVTVVGTVSGGISFFGQLPDQQSSGSGFIITTDGYILTNNHVVEGATQLKVVLADGTEKPANVVSTDQFADLAVLKVEGKMPAVAKLGNSDQLKPGETVIAIGSPLGDFKNSVTVGVVSATGRSLDTGNGYSMENLIQTDAAINQGNSGGPLLNLNGEVIGINTLIVRGDSGSAVAEGLGFAIPSNTARIIGEQMIQKGYYARPDMGVRWVSITPSIAARYGLPVQWGAYITAVTPDGPAAQAGIQADDILSSIGGSHFDSSTTFVNALFRYAPGDVVKIELIRENKTLTVNVKLSERKSQ
jgi:serine protease Do